MANFGDYPGDFRLQSGDSGKWFKIWTLPDNLSVRVDSPVNYPYIISLYIVT